MICQCYRFWLEPGQRVLDVGCGNGVVSKVIKNELGVHLQGADIAAYGQHDLDFAVMTSPMVLPFGDNSFTAVLLNDVLHHTENPRSLLLEASRVAAKKILVFEDIESWFVKLVDVLLNKIYFHGMKCPLNFKKPSQWKELFSQCGFQVHEEIPTYPAWYPIRHIAFCLVKKSHDSISPSKAEPTGTCD
jgi:ubiquinone/menaquinone biosynthesis C-methylase UbiE